MNIICALCGQKSFIDDKSPKAKRIHKYPTDTYICDICYNKITIKTQERISKKKNN